MKEELLNERLMYRTTKEFVINFFPSKWNEVFHANSIEILVVQLAV